MNWAKRLLLGSAVLLFSAIVACIILAAPWNSVDAPVNRVGDEDKDKEALREQFTRKPENGSVKEQPKELKPMADPPSKTTSKEEKISTKPKTSSDNAPALPREVTNLLQMKMVLVPKGSFLMRTLKGKGDSRDDRPTSQEVAISSPFYMGSTEVTVGQFREFIQATGYRTDMARQGKSSGEGFSNSSKHPVVLVSWNDAVKFCEWLSLKESKTYELPTVAEWEYASRAGSEHAYCFGAAPRCSPILHGIFPIHRRSRSPVVKRNPTLGGFSICMETCPNGARINRLYVMGKRRCLALSVSPVAVRYGVRLPAAAHSLAKLASFVVKVMSDNYSSRPTTTRIPDLN